jgi:trk system potassium uptake protein TrkA
MPNGRTTFAPGDELCVVGGAEEIGRFVDWAAPGERPVANIVIAGATRLTLLLAEQLRELGLRVVMIEADAAKAEHATDLLGGLVIHGPPTNVDVLREARVDRCDGFVSMQEKNEETIMACMLAKQQGALKTVALSNSPNHLQMITSMPSIDCGFSPRLAAINHVIRHLPENSDGIRTTLKRTPVEVREYTVVKRSPIANARICDATIPEGVIIGCIVRDGELLPAAGSEKLLRGDRACVISRPENAIKAANLFRCTEKKGA